jgi:hypothetical protein
MGGFKIAIGKGKPGSAKEEKSEGEPPMKAGEVDEPENDTPSKSKGGFKSFIKGKKK